MKKRHVKEESLYVKKLKSRRVLTIIILAAVLLGIASYLTFVYAPKCNSFKCFQSAMKQCKPVSYINEEPEASWQYKITGINSQDCQINVKLLQAKVGELGVEKLAGYSMQCSYPKGVADYPEKDLSMCHGRLKEELQQIIINKLHAYIIENLGKFDEALNKAV